MKQILTFLLAFLFCAIVKSQCCDTDVIHKAIIWRGFHHQWKYNHRINCLGDFVKRFDGDHGNNPTATHISATGTGPDNTLYNSYYTLLNTKSSVFLEMHRQVHLRGLYDDLVQETTMFDFPFAEVASYMCEKTDYVAMLNGFEMHADSLAADKIKYFELDLSDGCYDRAACDFKMGINAHVELNCYSAECTGPDTLDYFFDVYFVIMAYNKGDVAVQRHNISVNETWTTCKELNAKPIDEIVSADPSSDLGFATVGIKSFSVRMRSRAEHTLLWDNYLLPPQVTAFSQGIRQIEITGALQYKQWTKGMQMAHPVQSFGSFRQAGNADITMDYVTLQFKSVDSYFYGQHHEQPVMFWPGAPLGKTVPSFTVEPKTGKVIYKPDAIQIYNIATEKMESQ